MLHHGKEAEDIVVRSGASVQTKMPPALFGLLAFPAGHSKSPAIHNAAFQALSINARYELFEIPEAGLCDFLQRVRCEPIFGLSVSIPYKETICQYLDEIDPDAANIGAVNTVVNMNGVLKGYNTDFSAAVEALESVEPLSGNSGKQFFWKQAVVIGAGGAARAIVYGLLQRGCKVILLNRTLKKAQNLAQDMRRLGFSGIETSELAFPDLTPWNGLQKTFGNSLCKTFPLPTGRQADLTLINATSVGMVPKSDQCPVDEVFLSTLSKNSLVFDIVYTPLQTRLIQLASKAGLRVLTGDQMFLRQAAKQFELWTHQKAPLEVMRRAFARTL